MLVIRKKQMQTMGEAAARDFEQRMVAHLHRHFPEECLRAGEQRVRAAILQGIQRAGAYGIEAQRDVAIYIDLSVALGLDFDSGRRYPWAAEILKDGERSPAMKVYTLVRRAREHLEQPKPLE